MAFWNCWRTIDPVFKSQIVKFFCCPCGFWNVCKYVPKGEKAVDATPAAGIWITSLPESVSYITTAFGVVTASLAPSSLNFDALHGILPKLTTIKRWCPTQERPSSEFQSNPVVILLLLQLWSITTSSSPVPIQDHKLKGTHIDKPQLIEEDEEAHFSIVAAGSPL